MSEAKPIPVLQILDSEPVGVCEPHSDYCDVPSLRAAVHESPDAADPTAQDAEG